MTPRSATRTLARYALALAAGTLLLQTSCTLSDMLSAYGLSSLLSSLSTST